MDVLVIDVGGTSVKILATGQKQRRRFPSGNALTPQEMVAKVRDLAAGWNYDAIAIGYPGIVINGKPTSEPHNLARGWVGFDYAAAFERPVKILNDAAMQALGSYQGGVMLFLGFGTGLGSAIVAHRTILPMELGHLSYRDGTYEDYVGRRGLEKYGSILWREHVALGVARLVDAFLVDEVVIGGGHAGMLDSVHPKCRVGDNANAFIGGLRMWQSHDTARSTTVADYDVPLFGLSGDRDKMAIPVEP